MVRLFLKKNFFISIEVIQPVSKQTDPVT